MNKKSSIIHIHFSLGNGGSEQLMVDLANEQLKKGHRIAIIIINKGIENSIKERIDRKIKTYFVNRPPKSKNIFYMLKLAIFLLKCRNSQVIHSHSIDLGKYLIPFFFFKKCITVHDINCNLTGLRYYDRIFSISKAVQEDVKTRSGIDSKLIYNGVIGKQIQKKTSFNQKICIVQISRLVHEKKGQDIALEAIKYIINHQLTQTEFTLDFIGDGPSLKYLQDKCRDFNLSKNVVFLGNQSRNWIYDHICKYDILIQASRFEGFGLTIAEGIFAKIPIIASNIDGQNEILNEGEYGTLFETENAIDLAHKIVEVIDQIHSKKINQIIDKAYTHFCKTFQIENSAEQYLNEYLLKN